MSEGKIKKVSIVCSKGSLEGVYPALIMANGARMEGIEASIFFTFFGLYAILKEYRSRLGNVVVHCFTGNREQLHDYIELDCHIGITGWICDERRGTHMKEFLHDIPIDRLMVETDAPYLKPRNLRPLVKTHRNEPRWLPWIVGTLAAARGEHPDYVAE